MPKEIEIKLAFPPEARASILSHPLLAQAARIGRAQNLINTYFDTPDMALSAQRVALRTRRAGKLWLQTVKCAAASLGGLSARPEWEQAFNGNFDFSAVTAEPARQLLEKHVQHIVPLFTTNFHRETLRLTPQAGVSILVMMDCGEVSAKDQKECISELELELETGSTDDLLAIACALSAKLPLRAFDTSKAERGYRLFRQEPLCPARITAPSLDLQAMPVEAFRTAAFQAITAWAANHQAALSSPDPEYTHQIRLALRRLRNLIQLFAPTLPTDFVTHWQRALRAEAQALAQARALSVLCTDVLNASLEGDSDGRLPPLLSHARSAAHAAYTAQREHLEQAGSGAPLLTLSRALHALPEASPETTLPELLHAALRTQLRQARRRLSAADAQRSPEKLHALRISLKRVRHTLESLSAARPSKAQRRLHKALSRLLAELGSLHDLAEALPSMTRWAQQEPALEEGLAYVVGWHAATSLKLRQRILPRCAQFLKKQHWHSAD